MAMRRQRFAPADGLTIRDPISNQQRKGNIMNPYRDNMGVGRMSPNSRGLTASDSSMNVRPPSATQRRFPVKGG